MVEMNGMKWVFKNNFSIPLFGSLSRRNNEKEEMKWLEGEHPFLSIPL